MTQEVYGSVASWSPEKLKKFIQSGSKPVKVINNALSDKASNREKMIKVLSDYTTGNKEISGKKIFHIKCPISSIFDAQGSFGSCNFLPFEIPDIILINLLLYNLCLFDESHHSKKVDLLILKFFS